MGSNATLLFQNLHSRTPSGLAYLVTLGWHYKFLHKTTTKSNHPLPKKHIRKKPFASATMFTPPDHSPPVPAFSGTLEYDKDFSILSNVAKKVLSPPPACPLSRNRTPLKAGPTKSQFDKERKIALATKTAAAKEKKLTVQVKKAAAASLKEKKKHLLAELKASHEAKKVDAICEKLALVEAAMVAPPHTTPTSSCSGHPSPIQAYFPKKTKMMSILLTPNHEAHAAGKAISPQHKGTSPKKRVQLLQVPTFSPQCEVWQQEVVNLDTSSSGSYESSKGETKDDTDVDDEDNGKEDSIDHLVAGFYRNVPNDKSAQTLFTERHTAPASPNFKYPHGARMHPEVAKGLTLVSCSLEE
jgi:hypothetical protein